MKKILISVLALIPLSVSAIGVPTSGIDWSASTVSVQSFVGDHPSHETNFQCFGNSFADLPITVTLDQLAFAKADPGPESEEGLITGSTCFQQAGEYQLQIRLVDQAGNVGTAEAYVLMVRAAEAGSLYTTLEPVAYTKETNNTSLAEPTITGATSDCTAERLVANAEDDCQLRLTLRDDFGNVVVVPGSVGDITVPNRDVTNRDLNTIANPDQSFLDGIRLNGGTGNLNFVTDSNGSFDFDVSALAPSLEVFNSVADAAFTLGRIVSKPTSFTFPVPNVADDGQILATTTNLSQSIDLQFEPWVKLFLSDVAPGAGAASEPNDPLYFLLGDIKTLYAFADTTLDHFLPDSFEVFVKGFTRPIGITFVDEDLTNGPRDIDGDSTLDGLPIAMSGNSRTRNSVFETVMTALAGLNTDENVALGSKIQHVFTGESSGSKTVTYPGGNLGSYVGPDPAFPGITLPDPNVPGGRTGTATALLVGADIEGKILAEVDINVISDDTQLVNIGGTSVLDVREEIVRNAETLTRGMSPLNTPGSDINFNINTGFTNGDVAYFQDATVTLTGGTPMVFDGGAKTIVIEDGNLFIPNDLVYAGDFDDSLGIILINTDVSDRSNGNIFVKNNVQRLAGTYYAEGAFLSTTVISDPQYDGVIANRELTNVDDPNAPLGLQLLLEGTILTRNSLGGALLDPLQTPYGVTDDRAEAIRYDLNFVRRYVPPIDPVTLQPLSDAQNNQCVKVDGVCDRNKHSFVIRADGLVRNLTPPGFDQVGGFSAQ